MTRSPNPASRRHGRRGAILLIVLTLLALFAVIGLSFVFYAESQANQSRNYRDSVQGGGSNLPKDSTGAYAPDPQVAVNALLGQFLVPGQANQDSALYGHELWRTMYGGPLPATGQPGSVPYNGMGLVHQQVTTPLGAFDRADAIRFTRWLSPYGNTGLATQIDPETLYTVPAGGFNVKSGANLATTPTGAVFVPKNAGYTYPDRNNALLTALDPLHGQTAVNKFSVIAPSGHRPRLFDPAALYGDFGFEPQNPAWYAATGYFQTLRPRPIDHMTASDRAKLSANPAFTALGIPLPIPATLTPAQATALGAAVASGKFVLSEFPMPPRNTDGTITGDVQNVRHTNGTQHNDSVWVSIGATPVKFRDTYIVPMVALNLTDLHGRVNASVAGNVLNYASSPTAPHSSNQGFGPHEINLGVTAASTVGGTQQGLMPDNGAAAAAIFKRTGGSGVLPTTPVPPSYPTEAQVATTLAGGTLYPAYPSAYVPPGGTVARRVFPVMPFQPSIEATNREATFTPGTSSALQLTQAQPRPDAAVSFSGLGGTHDYPGVGSLSAMPFATVPANPTLNGRKNSDFTGTTMPGVAPTGEALDNPLGFNPYLRRQRTPENDVATEPQVYPTSDSKRLVARWSDKSQYINDTVLGKAVPYPGYARSVAAQFPTAEANVHRSGLTPVSNALHAPGLSAMGFGVYDASIAGATIATPGRRSLQFDPANNSYPFPSYDAVPTSDLARIAGPGPYTPAGPFGGQPTGDASDVTDAYTNVPAPPAGLAANLPTSLANVRAALAAVDVNRALPEYRPNLALPLSTTNCYNPTVAADLAPYNAAVRARQQLAQDIFTRLCVATGASVRFYPTALNLGGVNNGIILPQPTGAVPPYRITIPLVTGVSPLITVDVSEKEYSALRFLAQVSANIVDAIDTDDISTPFVWNPSAPAAQPYYSAADFGAGAELNSVSFLQNRVVFGVEKPRVVINEVYPEIANQPGDLSGPKSTNGFDVRFWLELLNAGANYSATNAVIDPSVQLTPATPPMNATNFSPYKIVVTQNTNVATVLADKANVLGDPPANPVIDFKFLTGRLTAGAGVDTTQIAPNNGQFQSTTNMGTITLNGFYVVGPTLSGVAGNPAFAPDPATQPYDKLIQASAATASTVPTAPATGDVPTTSPSSDGLSYMYGNENRTTFDGATGGKNYAATRPHAVLLRRLANPYVPDNTSDNPYVTVDMMTQVKAADAVKYASDTSRTPSTTNRASLARRQPYTGDPALTPPQANTTVPPSAPAVSFFQHNTATTVAFPGTTTQPTTRDANLEIPFEWMPHFDRRLINAEELLNVPVSRPHELTQHFAQPDPTPGNRPLFHQYTLRTAVEQRNPALPATITPLVQLPGGGTGVPAQYAPLYRALELLTVKPWVTDIPHGGRVPGKINPNAIQDKLVFDAWIDQQSTSNKFTVTERDELWKRLMLSRSAYDITNPTPTAPNLYPRVLGDTYDEVGATSPAGLPSHRPFKSFGAGQFPGSAAELVKYPTGVEDTLLRHLDSAAVKQSDPTRAAGTQTPLFSRYEPSSPPASPPAANAARSVAPGTADPVVPYTESEPLRKLLNNLTTTSDTFQLVFTVGYFEAREYQPGQPVILGKEMFLKVPGDLRSQFTAVLDRSMLTQQTPTVATPLAVLETREPLPPLPTVGATYLSNPNAGVAQGLVLALNAKYPVTVPPAPSFTSATRSEELLVSGAMEATGTYEGRKITVAPGTVLYVGTGANRMRVKAYFDPTAPYGPSCWTYNPLTGTVRISYQVDNPQPYPAALKDYPAGSLVSNYQFGPQTAPPLDATTNPAVLYFGRLTP